ncbi:hypothetical protein C0J52_20684 [Blattella germanica]|nr:hypothetical protein C0J52_20684 [Blattella germanica]
MFNMANYVIHPVLQDMINLGCRDQFNVGIAYQVYLNLCEVQAMRDVKYHYNKELDLLYLTGVKEKVSESSLPEIYLPLSTVSEISTSWISNVQDALCNEREDKGLTLAIKDHDSTVVYYRVTQGLVPPDSPETGHRKKKHEDKKHSIEVEVRKMQRELFNKAINANKNDLQVSEKVLEDIDVENDKELVVDIHRSHVVENSECSPLEEKSVDEKTDDKDGKDISNVDSTE